jgi:NIMA (never in mitosis gene a)-related kinase
MIDISRASKQESEDALKESQVLSSLKHPYVVRYRESFHEAGFLCIVMDYCEGGDLNQKIKRTRQAGSRLPEDQVMLWFTQAILALKYIHDKHILHRDLKSGNFFISKAGNMKLGDFGIARVLECTAACAQTQIGTPYYLSPEICQGKPYAWGSDIWSMGCILYEMCALKVPFDAPDLGKLIKQITKGPNPDLPEEYSDSVREIMQELLDRDPERRPQAATILKKAAVQDMVKRMLDDRKDDAPAAEGKAQNRTSSVEPKGGGGSAEGAATYTKDQAVEFYSNTHKEWLPAIVTEVEPSGRIQLNVKPNVWLNLEVQAKRVRAKSG